MLAFCGMEFTLSFLAVERFSFSPTQLGGMFILAGIVLILVQGILVRKLANPVGENILVIIGYFLQYSCFSPVLINRKPGILSSGYYRDGLFRRTDQSYTKRSGLALQQR